MYIAVEQPGVNTNLLPIVINEDGKTRTLEQAISLGWERTFHHSPAERAANTFAIDIPELVRQVRACTQNTPEDPRRVARTALAYSGGYVVGQMIRMVENGVDLQEAARLMGQGVVLNSVTLQEQKRWALILGRGIKSYIRECSGPEQQANALACRGELAVAFNGLAYLIMGNQSSS